MAILFGFTPALGLRFRLLLRKKRVKFEKFEK
jgi:hypothetical protein